MDYRTKITQEIDKKYGKGVIQNASNFLDREEKVVSVGPTLDMKLGGGIPEGNLAIFSGMPKLGKTSLAFQVAANAQEQYDKCVYVLPVEGRLRKMNLMGTHNLSLDEDKFVIVGSTGGKLLTAEENLTIAENIIKSHPGCVLIIDSLSALVALDDRTEEFSHNRRPITPKLLALFFKRISNLLPVQNTIVLGIQHVMQTQGNKGSFLIEDGGLKAQFYKNVHLRLKSMEHFPNPNTPLGQKIKLDILCSALGGPCKKVETYLRYGYGVDDVYELLSMALDVSLIEKSGAWFAVPFLDDTPKFQGMENLCQHFYQNPEHKEVLKSSLEEILK